MPLRFARRRASEQRSATISFDGSGAYATPLTTIPTVHPLASQAGASPIPGTGKIEAAIGLTARAIASARVTGTRAENVTPAMLDQMVRSMMVDGEAVYRIDTDDYPPTFTPARTPITVLGGPDPATWSYQLDMPGPTTSEWQQLPADSVLHVMWATTPDCSWRGISPLRGPTALMLARIDAALAAEAAGGGGYMVPIEFPREAELSDEQLTALQASFKARYNTGDGSTHPFILVAGGKADKPERWGINPPQHLVTLREQVEHTVVQALGIPASLLATVGTNTADQAALRRWRVTTLEPLARTIAREITAKLGEPVTLDLDSITTTESAMVARAIKGYVEAGLPLDTALQLVDIHPEGDTQ